jgi:hypothetical protein
MIKINEDRMLYKNEKNINNAAINIQDIGFVIKISSVKP